MRHVFTNRALGMNSDANMNNGDDARMPTKPSRFRLVVYWFCLFGANTVAEPGAFWFLPASWRYRIAMQLSNLASKSIYLHHLQNLPNEEKQAFLDTQLHYSSLVEAINRDDANMIQRMCEDTPLLLDKRFFGRTPLERAVEDDATQCIRMMCTLLLKYKPHILEAQTMISQAFKYCTLPKQVCLLAEFGGNPKLAPQCTDLVAQNGYPKVVIELLKHGGRVPNRYCLELMQTRPGHFEQLEAYLLETRLKQRHQVLLVMLRVSPQCYQVDDLAILIFQFLGIATNSQALWG